MSRHPVTPMREADLRRHLADQTSGSVGLMSLEDLDGSPAQVDARFAQRMAESPAMLLFDVLDDVRLREAGRLIWDQARTAPQFVVGSSGVGYALAAYWRAAGLIARCASQVPNDQTNISAPSALRQRFSIHGAADRVGARPRLRGTARAGRRPDAVRWRRGCSAGTLPTSPRRMVERGERRAVHRGGAGRSSDCRSAGSHDRRGAFRPRVGRRAWTSELASSLRAWACGGY